MCADEGLCEVGIYDGESGFWIVMGPMASYRCRRQTGYSELSHPTFPVVQPMLGVLEPYRSKNQVSYLSGLCNQTKVSIAII